MTLSIKKHIKNFKFRKRNSEIRKICKKYQIRNFQINDDGSIDVIGNVSLSINEVPLPLIEIPIKFRNVYGNFDCSVNNLKNCKNFPIYVKGNINCSHNEIETLDGFPKIVDGNCRISYNKLVNLKGISKEIWAIQ